MCVVSQGESESWGQNLLEKLMASERRAMRVKEVGNFTPKYDSRQINCSRRGMTGYLIANIKSPS